MLCINFHLLLTCYWNMQSYSSVLLNIILRVNGTHQHKLVRKDVPLP